MRTEFGYDHSHCPEKIDPNLSYFCFSKHNLIITKSAWHIRDAGGPVKKGVATPQECPPANTPSRIRYQIKFAKLEKNETQFS